MKKHLITVVWFNKIKNFGQGITNKGQTVFIIGAAFKNTKKLKPAFCFSAELKKDKEFGLCTYRIIDKGF